MTYEVNWIDIVLLTVLGLSAMWGFFRGLIRGVFGIFSLILAFFVAKIYGFHVADIMQNFLGESALTAAAGYVLTFVLSAVVFSAFTYLLYRMAVSADLGTTDRMGGLYFGIVRGLMIDMVAVFLLAALPVQSSEAWQKSALLPVFGHAIRITVSLTTFSEYRKYWVFQNGRPRLTFSPKEVPNVIPDIVPDIVSDTPDVPDTPVSPDASNLVTDVVVEPPCETLVVDSEGVTLTVLEDGAVPCAVESQ